MEQHYSREQSICSLCARGPCCVVRSAKTLMGPQIHERIAHTLTRVIPRRSRMGSLPLGGCTGPRTLIPFRTIRRRSAAKFLGRAFVVDFAALKANGVRHRDSDPFCCCDVQ